MFFDILTLFPAMFEGVFGDSIIRRALDGGKISLTLDNIRDYAQSRHNTVDDYPYGGDAGMLLKPEPLARAITAARKRHENHNPVVLLMSPQGEKLDHARCVELGKESGLILVCGRYKGVDQRIIDHYIDREISIGDYVLSGGEIAAMVVVETITRLIPGVLGDRESAERDSFYNGLLSPPHYTRPEEFEGVRVPEVLLSGHHAHIAAWQHEQALAKTALLRPDLYQAWKEQKHNL